MTNCFAFRKIDRDGAVFIVLNEGVFYQTDFIADNNIDIIHRYMSLIIGKAFTYHRKSYTTIDVSFAFFYIIVVAESDDGNIFLRITILVFNCYDYGSFNRRFYAFRKVNYDIVAFTDINVAIRNYNIFLIGYTNNESELVFVFILSDSTVIVSCRRLIVRNPELTVCICCTCCSIVRCIINEDLKVSYSFLSFSMENSDSCLVFIVQKSSCRKLDSNIVVDINCNIAVKDRDIL